jgi:hypothetical protein
MIDLTTLDQSAREYDACLARQQARGVGVDPVDVWHWRQLSSECRDIAAQPHREGVERLPDADREGRDRCPAPAPRPEQMRLPL